ncbi:MAG: RNA 2',3'-cyclic phosphodiesterase [Lactobacillales bacterium]|jgi:2'-5' RNA ligase|nr:RNA 2',3'-cyclic phosphodiesterase [Lactobacillales bacterium]
MIRLFIGLDLPQDIKEQVYSLRGGLQGALWRPMEKINLNLRFIGNVEEHVACEIEKELSYIRFPAFEISLKEIGYFDTGGIPRHLWVGVDGAEKLKELQEKIVVSMKRLGLENTDKFKFKPHVTIAKLQGTNVPEMFNYIAQNNLFHTRSFTVDSFALFSSHARENGEGKYHRIEREYPLTKA